MLYTEYLTPEERAEAIRDGAEAAMEAMGVPPMSKSAQARITIPTPSISAIGNAAIVAGVPLGLLYYIVNRSISKTDKKTRKLQKELDYYNDVAAEFRNNYGAGDEEDA